MTKVPLTARGAAQLREELRRLKAQRPRISAAIGAAREHGDLRENAEYHAAKEQQGLAEARIRDIEAKLSNAQIIEVSKLNAGGKVVFGATVRLLDPDAGTERRYQIVGEDEADIKEGRVSISSPVARAVIGRFQGEIVEVDTRADSRTTRSSRWSTSDGAALNVARPRPCGPAPAAVRRAFRSTGAGYSTGSVMRRCGSLQPGRPGRCARRACGPGAERRVAAPRRIGCHGADWTYHGRLSGGSAGQRWGVDRDPPDSGANTSEAIPTWSGRPGRAGGRARCSNSSRFSPGRTCSGRAWRVWISARAREAGASLPPGIVGPTGRVWALDREPMDPIEGVTFIRGDFTDPQGLAALRAALGQTRIDLVMSDMAPNISGHRVVDQPRAMRLAEAALAFAAEVLGEGGGLLVKVFQGEGFEDFVAAARRRFKTARVMKPRASRPESREMYVLARTYGM